LAPVVVKGNHLEYKPILLEFAKLTKNNIVT